MGVSEIRSAMLQAENGRALFTRWRNERVAMLLAGESPAQIPTANGKVVLHLAPFVSSVPGYSVDVNALIGKFDITRPLTSGGHGNRYNLDGVLTYGISREHETGYIQFFRDGRIEIVDASLLCERRGKNGQVQLYIPGTRFEEDIINVLKRMISAFQLLNVQPPIALMLSIVNAKGYEMFAGSDFSDDGQRPIGREVLAFPDFVWNEIPKNVDSAVKPMLDLVWNACGWRGSMNYDENGLRETRRQ